MRGPEAGGEELVFVYGTLRRSFGNHYLLQEGARSLGPARTVARYALYALEIPFAVKGQAVSPLIGELYAVTPATLVLLDELEDHPRWYRRELVALIDQAGAPHQAWVYFYPQPRGELVPSGDFAQVGRPGQD